MLPEHADKNVTAAATPPKRVRSGDMVRIEIPPEGIASFYVLFYLVACCVYRVQTPYF
jgi:hypothetical protein